MSASPLRAAPSTTPSMRKSMLASAAAQLTGLPPKVVRWSPIWKASAISARAMKARQRPAVGDALGHGHDVGLDAVVLDGEQLAGAPEAALDLVGDEEDALLVEDLLDALEVAVRRHDDAALAHHRLGDEGADVAREVQAGDLADAARAEQVALVGRGLGEAAVAVRRGREGDARHVGAAALLAARVAGHREGRVACGRGSSTRWRGTRSCRCSAWRGGRRPRWPRRRRCRRRSSAGRRA